MGTIVVHLSTLIAMPVPLAGLASESGNDFNFDSLRMDSDRLFTTMNDHTRLKTGMSSSQVLLGAMVLFRSEIDLKVFLNVRMYRILTNKYTAIMPIRISTMVTSKLSR
ncbi:hypothetical protein D3C80_1956280 [compost metagenome]